MENILEKDKKYVWHPFTPQKTAPELYAVKEAKGATITTTEDKVLIDAISSWWVNIHGHSNEYIAKAAYEQASHLEHVIFAGFTHEPAVKLAERLIEDVLPSNQSKVFFSDNGSTSTEVGMKMAFQYFWNKGIKNKHKIIAFEGAYHGDTFGAMSVADRGPFTEPFFPFLFDVEILPLPEAGKEEEVVKQFAEIVEKGDVAAFIYEPLVQGSGGMRMYTPEVLDTLMSLAKKQDVICIADEVMTGFGRTGKKFASFWLTENQPDIMCLSKGLTGGTLALGITTCSERIYEAYNVDDFMKTFFHGHSFTANPIACSVANASLDIFLSDECQQNIQRVTEQHQAFMERAKSFKNARNIRQRGTIIALDFVTEEESSYFNKSRNKLYETFIGKGVLLRPLGNVIYILPPYIISNEQLEKVYQAIEEVMG